MSVLIFLVITGIVGGGASIAAEASLPGDVLYPIKTGVNEPIRGLLTVGAEADAELESDLAIRRIVELQKLSVRGKVDSDVSSQLQSRFRAHAERANERISNLEARGAVEVSSRFQSSLRAHSEVLSRLAVQQQDDSEVLSSFAVRLNTVINNTARVRAEAETEVSTETGAEVEAAARGRLTATVNKITEVKNFIASMRARAGADASARAEAKISAAETLAAEGEAKIESGAYGEAFITLQRAHQEAQEAQVLMQSIININIGGVRTQLETNTQTETNTGTQTETNSETNNGGTSGRIEVEVGL